MTPALRAELKAINALYKIHWLRYGTVRDIIGPIDIDATRTLRRIRAVVRLVERRKLAVP